MSGIQVRSVELSLRVDLPKPFSGPRDRSSSPKLLIAIWQRYGAREPFLVLRSPIPGSGPRTQDPECSFQEVNVISEVAPRDGIVGVRSANLGVSPQNVVAKYELGDAFWLRSSKPVHDPVV